MEYGPPPLFNQGVSARARLAFFSLAAALLIVIDAQVNALDVIRNGVEILLYPFQRVLLWPRDVVADFGGYIATVGDLNEENSQLRKAAVEQAQRAQLAGQLQLENEQLRKLAGLRERINPPSQLVTALYESRDPFSHKIVIDRGSKDGIRAGGPVIDETGVVGQVTRVFPMTAEVTLLTDKEQSLPVQVARNGLRAIAFGGSEAMTLELRFLPSNADVQSGDSVVTSGLDGMYPSDMPVGVVTRIDRDVKDQFARVILKPVAGMSKSRLLLVLIVEPPPLAPVTSGRESVSNGNRGERVGNKAARR
ncbi:MAG TPA: rod shape-determining protein MreC [Burkholderiaceae bacterium]|nr:rod shape-determining protein MreC [Burkholderiaceae bacterium]